MTVYVLEWVAEYTDHDCRGSLGVYSTQERAEAAGSLFGPRALWVVTPVTVDAPPDA